MATAYETHFDTAARERPSLLPASFQATPLGRIVEQTARAFPFLGCLSISGVSDTVDGGDYEAIIAIPARSEEKYLANALASVAKAVAASTARCAVIVIVNNSHDSTFKVAQCELARHGIPGLALDSYFERAIADIGHVRRFALDLASAIPGARYLLSADADGQVAPNWISRAVAALEVSEMVCGTVDADPTDLARLPASVTICGQVEAELRDALNDLWRAINGPSSRGFTNRGSGANMAVRAGSYLAAGGLPAILCGEDRALHSLFEAQGRSIRHDDAMKVTVSGRTVSEVAGGMAACLASRAQQDDPYVDDQLMPAQLMLKRALSCRDNVHQFPQHGVTPLRVSQARVESKQARSLAKKIRAGVAPINLLRDDVPVPERCE